MRADIARVHDIIRPYIRETPVLAARGSDIGLAPFRLTLKLEFVQHSGSFKVRGAFTNLLTRTIPASGVAAASGGNHGAAVAYAAKRLGIAARIFVPTVVSAAKLAGIRACGATVIVTGDRYADALDASERYVAESHALPIHAYDQWETLQGQGTLALELEEQSPRLDALLVAVGGGGLIGGIAGWYAGRVPVIGVEPEEAPTLAHALAAGEPVDAPAGGVAADSLAPKRVGSLMFPVAQKYLAGSVLVPDAAIREAQKALWKTLRVVAEPGGATAMAALLSGRHPVKEGQRIGVVLCGANTTAVRFD